MLNPGLASEADSTITFPRVTKTRTKATCDRAAYTATTTTTTTTTTTATAQHNGMKSD